MACFSLLPKLDWLLIYYRNQVALVVPILMAGGGGLLRLSGKPQFLQGGQ